MRGFVIFTLLATQVALAQYPSAAGLPFSPTMPYSVNDVPNVTQAPANGGFSSGYYYGYGQYGYGYPAYGNGYGYGYGPNSYYNKGMNYNSNNYNQNYQGYNGNVGARYPANGQQMSDSRAFPSASQESSLHRGW